METAKVQFSREEMQLMENGDLILTKNRIIDKVSAAFEMLAGTMSEDIATYKLPVEVMATGYKISKGEKYKGLPYVILDAPRYFGKEDIFAIRTLFWWGNYFSVTLHVKGVYAPVVKEAVLRNRNQEKIAGFYISYSGDEWNHDIMQNNYVPISDLRTRDVDIMLNSGNFFKLAVSFKLGEWSEVKEMIINKYRQMLEMVHT